MAAAAATTTTADLPLKEIAKIKLELPPRFSGKDNNYEFEAFIKRLRNYMCIQESDYSALFDYFKRDNSEKLVVTTEHYADLDSNLVLLPGTTAKLSQQLYYVLYGLLELPARNLVEDIDNDNGVEALRRLHERYKKSKMLNVVHYLHKITTTKFEERTFAATFMDWETDLSKLEAALGREVYEEMKIGLLIAGTTGKLRDHMCLSLAETTTVNYQTLRGVVLDYVRHHGTTTSKNKKEDNNMEVDAVWKGNYNGGYNKGKGNNHNNNSYNGKGKGYQNNYQKNSGYSGQSWNNNNNHYGGQSWNYHDKNKGKGKDYKGKGKDNKGGKGKGKTNHKGKYKVNNVDNEVGTGQDEWKQDYDQGGDTWNSWDSYYDHQGWNNGAENNTGGQGNGTTETATVSRIELHTDEEVAGTTMTARYAIMGVLPETKTGQPMNYLLVDSGAVVSVCPWDYKEELGVHFNYQSDARLTAANGTTMKIYGKRRIPYWLDNGIGFTIDYYVCDTTSTIISTNCLGKENIKTTFGNESYIEQKEKRHYLTKVGHLSYLREKTNYHIGNYFYDSQGTRIKDDYWIVDNNNHKAIRVHVRFRKELYLPGLKTTMPGPERDTDPYIHLLGEQRTTVVYYRGKETSEGVVLKDDKTTKQTLDDWWVGHTTFELLEEKLAPTIKTGTVLQDTRQDDDMLMTERTTTKESETTTMAPPPGLEHIQPQNVDYWKRDGNKWTRYHKIQRKKFFNPAETLDGPDVTRLQEERITTTRYNDGTTEVHTDNWKSIERQQSEARLEWIGTTTFTEKDMFYGELRDSVTEQGRPSKGLECPEKPTQLEIDQHNLTHLPFRSWCTTCVKARGLPDHHHKRDTPSKLPVIQIDYAFVTSKENKEQTTLLTAVDIETGMSLAVVVDHKGTNDYAIAELVRFLHETGRTQGTLQTGVVQSDQENSIKQLLRDLSTATGLPIRHSPTYSSQSLGALER